MFPNLPSVPILYLFALGRFIITFATICVSYSLSLHRDIHKLSIASIFALCGVLIVVASVMFEGPVVSPLVRGDLSKQFLFIKPAILYWGDQLPFRLPPYFAINIWELEDAES